MVIFLLFLKYLKNSSLWSLALPAMDFLPMSFTSLIDFLHFITFDSYKLPSTSLFQFLIYCFFTSNCCLHFATEPGWADGQGCPLSRLWDGGFWLCNQLLLKNLPPVYQEGHGIKQGEGRLREAEVLRRQCSDRVTEELYWDIYLTCV